MHLQHGNAQHVKQNLKLNSLMLLLTKVSTCSSEKLKNLAKLDEGYYKLILSSNRWLDCDIIQEVHVCLQKVNPESQGLQRPTLRPVRNFAQVSARFIHIFILEIHTGYVLDLDVKVIYMIVSITTSSFKR